MLDNKEIIVISASNEKFVPHLATLILSLLKNKKKETIINFYIIDDDILLASKDKLNRMINDYKATICYLQINKKKFNDMIESDRITTTAYFRISIPNFFKGTNIHKVIYLDCDIISLQPIEELWSIELGENLIAAVEDAGFHHRLENMRIKTKSNRYFNSGVMLINIDKWRAQKISEQVINFALKNKDILRFHDQDALNAVLHDQWMILHPKWNAQSYIILNKKKHPTKKGQERYKETRQCPFLIHYSGHIKPWHKNSEHPYKNNYLKIRLNTPFPIS